MSQEHDVPRCPPRFRKYGFGRESSGCKSIDLEASIDMQYSRQLLYPRPAPDPVTSKFHQSLSAAFSFHSNRARKYSTSLDISKRDIMTSWSADVIPPKTNNHQDQGSVQFHEQLHMAEEQLTPLPVHISAAAAKRLGITMDLLAGSLRSPSRFELSRSNTHARQFGNLASTVASSSPQSTSLSNETDMKDEAKHLSTYSFESSARSSTEIVPDHTDSVHGMPYKALERMIEGHGLTKLPLRNLKISSSVQQLSRIAAIPSTSLYLVRPLPDLPRKCTVPLRSDISVQSAHRRHAVTRRASIQEVHPAIRNPVQQAAARQQFRITPDVAETIITCILEAMDSFEDLFAAARINKGFYSVFKRQELRLMKTTLRNMSPYRSRHNLSQMSPVQPTNRTTSTMR